MKRNLIAASSTLALMLASGQAGAVTMLIGDVDGFGFTNPNAYESAQNTNPDTDGDGIIEAGEYLPDLDNDGHVWVNGHDEFDNRSAAEASATNGAQWTDISLEDYAYSFGDSPANNALFTFDFAVPVFGDSDYGVDHFINFIFGDYDVVPASIIVDGVNVALTAQSGAEDGLVQLAYATVSWADMLDGQVVIDMYAPNEPYVAIDYAYLHTTATAAPADVSSPSALALLAAGLLGARVARRRA